MAEICFDCLKKEIKDIEKKHVVLSDYHDLCENCGKYKLSVITIKPSFFGRNILPH